MTHCSRHDVPILPGCLGCPVCAAEPVTVVCAWRHTHEGEKWIDGPEIGSGARTSHGICAECLEVERIAWAAEAEEMRAARERAKGGVEPECDCEEECGCGASDEGALSAGRHRVGDHYGPCDACRGRSS